MLTFFKPILLTSAILILYGSSLASATKEAEGRVKTDNLKQLSGTYCILNKEGGFGTTVWKKSDRKMVPAEECNAGLLYHFNQFITLGGFLRFRKCSENLINWEKIIGGVSENRVWRVTDELNENHWYSKVG
jgi:hypothetical protein